VAQNVFADYFSNLDPEAPNQTSENMASYYQSADTRLPERVAPDPARSKGDLFDDAMQAGAEGLAADVNYFGALFDTLTGDERGARNSLEIAQQDEEAAAIALADTESWGEFLDEPTFDGFLNQVLMGGGQAAPSVLTSVTGAGAGAAVTILGRLGANVVAKKAAKRVVKDSIERTAKGVADPDEKALAQAAYDALKVRQRGSAGRAAKAGAVGGAFASEYAPLAGDNLSEALDSGQDLDIQNALRASTIAIPQAAIGVGGEVALVKLLGKVASKRAAVEGGIFSQLSKSAAASLGKGALLEGGTELAQEGISIANRADLDPLFTSEDAWLRSTQAFFAGAVTGGALGGAGGAAAGTYNALTNRPKSDSTDSGPGLVDRGINAAAGIFDRASKMLDTAREQRVNQQINNEQYGNLFSGNTTPEPEGDIKAQLRAMVDPTSGKNAVWIAGESPVIEAQENRISLKAIAGETAYAAMIPGRGIIVSTNPGIVQEVIAAGASDQSLQKALGYSATKDYSNPGDIVVQVLDRDGRVISEEVTTAEGREAAYGAALKLRPDGGKIEETTVEKALEDRKRRFEAERPVEVRDMEFTEDQLNELRQRMQQTNDDSQVDDADPAESEVDTFDQGIQTVEGQRTVLNTYVRKTDPNKVFENTAQARTKFESVFGETNWADPRYAAMTESMLITAANAQRADPNSVFSIEDTPDGGFQIVQDNFGDLFRAIDTTGQETTLSLPAFLRSAVQRAKRSKYAKDSRVTIVAPDGKTSVVNLVDITFAGQRINETRYGAGFMMRQDRKGNISIAPFEAARAGLMEMFGTLLENGYDVQVDGQSILINTPQIPAKLGNVTAAIVGGRPRSLNALFRNQTQDKKRKKKSRGRSKAEIQRDNELALQRQRVESLRQQISDLKEKIESTYRKQGGKVYADAQRRLRELQERLTGAPEMGGFRSSSELGAEQLLASMEDPNYDPNATEFADADAPGGFTARDPDVEEEISLSGGQVGENEFTRMNESNLGGELATKMNIDTPKSAIDRRAAVPRQQTEEKGQLSVRLAVDAMVLNIFNDLIGALKLQETPALYSFDRLSKLTDAELETLIPSEALRTAVKDVIARMSAKDSIKGRHISGPGGRIIILRESGNQLQDALVVAHEVGHSLYKDERDRALANKAVRQRLIKAYQSSPTSKALTEKYGFDRGFEEWFSDQVALWAAARYKNRQAKSLTEKFFKDFVARMRQLWRSTAASVRARLGNKKVNQDFETFMDSILESRRTQVKDNGLSFTEKAFVYELRDLEIQSGGEARAAHWRKSARNILRNPKLRPLLKFVMTADGILRIYGNSEIADMFYVRSQDGNAKGRLGMIGQIGEQNREFINDLRERIGDFEAPDTIDAFRLAASDAKTADLQGKARQIRDFLDELYDNYIAPSNTDIGRQPDYFPVVLNLLNVDGRPDRFVQLIVQYNPSITEADARKAVNHLQRVQQAVRDDKPIEIDPTNPASDVTKAILLTKNVPRDVLQREEFLVEPIDAFSRYLRHVVKRVEWDRHTKDAEGNSKLEPLLKKLAPEDQALAREIISAYLGYQTKPLSPMFRKLNSYGQFLQFITILPFATLASLTDLAGPVINSKEFGSVTTAFKEIAATIKNRQEAAQFARDLGLVTNETVANAWITEAEQDYMDPKVRKMSDVYFRMIGLDFFTRFSREFAAGMGVQFILKHAHNEFSNPRSERYLRELGLTSAEVLAWERGGRKLTTPEGMKVKQGLQRFVESSILRPNAAERPLWASDPHWALVWQLKSYFYSYGKVILGGIKREASTRLKEGDGTPFEKMTAAGAVLALTAIATMPLAMLGMELREYAKYGMAWLLPGVEPTQRYFRSDRMDWPEYLGEVFDRSGFLGPIGLFTMANQSAQYGDNPIITLLGPTAETIDTTISNGWRVDRTIKDRLLPLYNQLYY
jgi:hypothetical protein